MAEDLCDDDYDWNGPYCQLPKGHEGEHYAEVRWPQPAPRDPNLPPAPSFFKPAIWAKTLMPELLGSPALGLRPVVARERVINRDQLEPEG